MVNKSKILGYIFQAPLLITFLASLGASAYAAYNKIAGVTYATTVFFSIMVVLYGVGVYLLERSRKNKVN